MDGPAYPCVYKRETQRVSTRSASCMSGVAAAPQMILNAAHLRSLASPRYSLPRHGAQPYVCVIIRPEVACSQATAPGCMESTVEWAATECKRYIRTVSGPICFP